MVSASAHSDLGPRLIQPNPIYLWARCENPEDPVRQWVVSGVTSHSAI